MNMKSAVAAPVPNKKSTDTSDHCIIDGHRLPADALKARVANSIGDDLRQVNQILAGQLQNPHAFVGEILEHAGRFRGKQIRPILLFLCYSSVRTRPTSKAHILAAVVEMIHTATLVHDDVLDDADTRRHDVTIHRRWNTETSLLLGDYLFSRAFRLAASTGDSQACEWIGKATDLTCAGELHQVETRLTHSRSEQDYFRVIRGKTAQLFGLSCHLGSYCAGAPDSTRRLVRLAGLEAGMAFQIADDLLDLTGHQTHTGKDTANDLANRHHTLPLLRALRLASDAETVELQERLNCSTGAGFSGARRRELLSHPAVARGLDSARRTARFFVDRALRRFDKLPESEERDLLQAIVRFAVDRQV